MKTYPITSFIFILQNAARRDRNQIHYAVKITFETPSFETTYVNIHEDYSVIDNHISSTRLNVIELFAMWVILM